MAELSLDPAKGGRLACRRDQSVSAGARAKRQRAIAAPALAASALAPAQATLKPEHARAVEELQPAIDAAIDEIDIDSFSRWIDGQDISRHGSTVVHPPEDYVDFRGHWGPAFIPRHTQGPADA